MFNHKYDTERKESNMRRKDLNCTNKTKLEKTTKIGYHLHKENITFNKEVIPMVTIVPKGTHNMTQKRKIVKANVSLYRKSNKNKKAEILSELQELTGYSRKYLIKLLSKHGKKIMVKKGVYMKADLSKTSLHMRGRKRKYPLQLRKYLLRIWKDAGKISSKHLKAYIDENKEWIFNNNGKLKDIPDNYKTLIYEMSSSTIERLIKDYKKKYKSIFKYNTRKTVKNHIKKQINIETFYNRHVSKIGYMQIDLVYHSGNRLNGDFLYTLTAVDVLSDWTSLRILKNRARVWTYQALEDIFNNIPYKVYHIHSDNGSEFINAHILHFLKEKGMKQTRSRSYKKNDNALVELKNWSMVRSYLGYRRYDTEEEHKILSELMKLIEIKHNFFIPTMKLVKVINKQGKKKKRIYETKTPYKRLLESNDIPEEKKQELIEMKKNLNLYEINRKIESLQKKLNKAYLKKMKRRNKQSRLDIDLGE